MMVWTKRFWKGIAGVAIALIAPLATAWAQAGATTHNLTLGQVVESIDKDGRKVLVSKVTGDLPGVLTLALVTDASGLVTGGEWALEVSYIQFGPPDADGDGDPSESLVQRGVIKGSITGGTTVLDSSGRASSVSNLQLNVTGATVEFSGTTAGSGSVLGSCLTQQAVSSGSFALTF